MLYGMSPLMKTLFRLMQSRKGRQLTSQAMTYAKSPQGQKAIAQARAQLAKGKKPR
jgi:hypothetical protein